MVETQLRTNSITERRLLKVFGELPREQFIPAARRELAYIDDVQPLGKPNRYLPPVGPFGRLIQLADLLPHEKVLDIACGTGYSTAVIARMAGQVVALDEDADLANAARANLKALGIANASVHHGALLAGVPSEAPYDAIIIEGAVDKVPDGIFDQLKIGGRCIALVSRTVTNVAHLFVRSSEGIASREEFNATLPRLDFTKRIEEFVF
jgi:protein-L-isoaspartate(D-aspartate) O-methyltransferase